MANVYLIAAAHCLRLKQKEQAMIMLSAALAEINKEQGRKLGLGQVMRALSFARRVP